MNLCYVLRVLQPFDVFLTKDMCPQPAAEQVCQKLALVGNSSRTFSEGLLKFHV